MRRSLYRPGTGKGPSPPAVSWLGIPASSIIPDVRTEAGGEVFAVNCYISGGSGEDEDIYGVYRLDSAFGLESDPGSLVSYRQLSQKDYWITDPEDEDLEPFIRPGRKVPERRRPSAWVK